MQKPFNEHLLWKGTIQRSNYSIPIRKSNMILPKINTLLGGTYDDEDIWRDITKRYDVYSKQYWERIKKTHTEYRNSSTGGLPFKRWYY
jgi:hypothetical protein